VSSNIGMGSNEDWRALIEAHWHGAENVDPVQVDASAAAATEAATEAPAPVTEILAEAIQVAAPEAAIVQPSVPSGFGLTPTLIEIEDDEDDVEEGILEIVEEDNDDHTGGYASNEARAENIDAQADAVLDSPPGDQQPVEDASLERRKRAAAEFQSALDDLPEEAGIPDPAGSPAPAHVASEAPVRQPCPLLVPSAKSRAGVPVAGTGASGPAASAAVRVPPPGRPPGQPALVRLGQPAPVRPPGQPVLVRPLGQQAFVRPLGQQALVRPLGQQALVRPPGQPAPVRPSLRPAAVRPPGQPAAVGPPGQPAPVGLPGQPAPVRPLGSATAAAKQYLVDNSSLQAKTHGLGYRLSKCIGDVDKSSTAAWGTTVVGIDDGDGWLRVGSKFLPMTSGGHAVLTAKVPLARTTSATLLGPLADRPAGVFVPRSAPQGLRRQASNGAAPAGLFVARSPGLKRLDSGGSPGGVAKRPKHDETLAATDSEGRRYNLRNIVCNFANVGATYACKVLGRDKAKGDRLFDWEGVRRCVSHLTNELGLEVIGVLMENFWAPDNSKDYKIGIPEDIRQMCSSIEETPKIQGRNHKSADDEMTIKCAYRRNCRFMDNDNYRDWKREMRNERVRSWLESSQEILQMRYFFDAELGTFDTLDGNIPAALLSQGRSP